MQIPEKVVSITKLLWAQHIDLARGDDNQRRALTKIIAEQVRFALGPSWGTKSAGEGRPPSKDAIAYVDEAGRLWGWDSLNGGTREVSSIREMEDITGQEFLPVLPIDHLNTGAVSPAGTPTGGPPPVQPPRVDVGSVVAAIAEVAALVKGSMQAQSEGFDSLSQQHERIYADLKERTKPVPPPSFPVYQGSITLFGRTLTLVLTPRA